MGKSQSKDSITAAPSPFVGDDDTPGQIYTLPDGTKSKFKYEERPVLKTIESETRVENM